MTIMRLDHPAPDDIAGLHALLTDAVEHGASVGFVLPLTAAVVDEFWRDVCADVADGSRILLLAREDGRIAGSVQLAFCTKPNGRHRADIQKLLVHSQYRQRGLGRALMAAVESLALQMKRTLLMLDTEAGSVAEGLYARIGYTRLGTVPRFAAKPAGGIEGSTFFYREL